MKEAAVILKEAGVIRSIPENYNVMYDASFIK
jgi:NitT/TauT family transport system substrate-binding protein